MVYVGELYIEHLPGGSIFTFFQAGVSCEWANDGLHLLLENFETICHSPSQIYHSALPLSPSSSWVHKCYSGELLGEVQVVKGLPTEWGSCFRTVTFNSVPMHCTCWKDTIAVGLESGNISILDGSTGSQRATLPGHTDQVRSLTFSSDGISLVSGSYDKTVKLWDVQTGGVVKTLCGHTDMVCSVSISADHTTIASGSDDKTIRLWDIQTGECLYIMEQWGSVECVIFSPIRTKCFISVSDKRVKQWNIDDIQSNPSQDGSYVAFSPDGTQLVLCCGSEIMVQDFDSGAILAKSHIPNSTARACCCSPDGRLVAVANENGNVHIWDITGSDPHLVETLIGHTDGIFSLVFSSPSCLVTSSWDRSAKFWQIGTPSTAPVVGHPDPMPLAPASIKSITLQEKGGVFVSHDLDGMVKTWDISTGLCKSSLWSPAKDTEWSNARLVDGRLILVWHADEKIHIWDVEKEELLHEIDAPSPIIYRLIISRDGSQVFCLHHGSIKALSTQTGKVVDSVGVTTYSGQTSLIVNGSRVWVHSPNNSAYKRGPQGWDFGIPESSPVQLPPTLSLHLNDTKVWDVGQSKIKDTTTGNIVLQLGGRFIRPSDVQLDGRYFLAHYWSGEVLILDFNHVPLW